MPHLASHLLFVSVAHRTPSHSGLHLRPVLPLCFALYAGTPPVGQQAAGDATATQVAPDLLLVRVRYPAPVVLKHATTGGRPQPRARRALLALSTPALLHSFSRSGVELLRSERTGVDLNGEHDGRWTSPPSPLPLALLVSPSPLS